MCEEKTKDRVIEKICKKSLVVYGTFFTVLLFTVGVRKLDDKQIRRDQQKRI